MTATGTERIPIARGFRIAPRVGAPGDYVIERSFVAR
jgi:hypothetical protein